MNHFRMNAVVLTVLFVLGLATTSAKADPLIFSNVVALQNNGSTRVDLFSHPGVTLLGPQVSFLVDIAGTLPPSTTNTLLVTYLGSGSAPIIQSFLIPLFGTIPPPFTLLLTITSPDTTLQGIPATLTVDILGSSPDFTIPSGPGAGQRVNSFTYAFNVATVPEPTTLLLFGTGLSGVAAALRRRCHSG